MSSVENAETMVTPETVEATSNGSENVLDPAVAKELANVREKIEGVKKSISDFVDARDEVTTAKTEDLENAVCEQSETVESRLADIEMALCELSESVAAAMLGEDQYA